MYASNKWKMRTTEVTLALENADKASTTVDLEQQELSKVLRTANRPNSLDVSVGAVVRTILDSQVHPGITMSALTPAALADKDGALLSFVENVPHTQIRSVKLTVEGVYETYPELLAYLRAFQDHPAAVVRLTVNDHTFSMSLRVYGT